MSKNFMKVTNGLTFKGQASVPTSPENGDQYYDSTRNTLVVYINGNWKDLQSKSDVATSASLTSSNFTASVVQSSLVRLTGSTVSSVHGMIAASDAKILMLYNESTAAITIKNASGTEGTAANRILCPNGSDVLVLAGQSVMFGYDGTQSRWILLSSPSSGSGTGSKNYLTQYTASTGSGALNPGNGNFELGSTSGWSLGTVGTLTNGIPTGSPTFGSGASGNLSISSISSGQLAGSYSLSYASSAATTQGNMLASDAFFIDLEDQAKVLTWKFNYNAQTNPANSDWSGTSSNSFGVAIYDVTNSAWLQSTSNFGMTQSSGVGLVTGTCQTNSTTTQLRFVVYNVNATSGATTLYFDDFFVGPQTAPIGAPMTDWLSYTPTITGFGTPTAVNFWYRRTGGNLQVHGSFLSGTPTAVGAHFTLPSGINIDSTKISPSPATNQYAVIGNGGATGINPGMLNVTWDPTSGTNIVALAINSNATGENNANNVTITGGFVTMMFEVPIVGWSSNVQMSNDTDTRVVSARYFVTSAASTTTPNPINYDTKDWDTHAAVTTGATTWKFTCPVTGYYVVESSNNPSTQSAHFLYKNGVKAYCLGNSTSSSGSPSTGCTLIQLNAGDTIFIAANNTQTPAVAGTGTTISNVNYISIHRLSGPSVIAATESVNARYFASSTALSGSLATIVYSSKDFDSHGAYSAGTFTVPVSGKYQVIAAIALASVTVTVGNSTDIQIQKNGTAISEVTYSDAASSSPQPFISDIINCLAGDTLRVQVSSSTTSPSITASNSRNYLSIARVGN